MWNEVPTAYGRISEEWRYRDVAGSNMTEVGPVTLRRA